MQENGVFKPLESGILNIRTMTEAELRAAESKRMPKNFESRTVSTRNVERVYGLYSAEFSQLAVENLKYYFECARIGLNFWKSLLFEEIRRRDLHIGGVLQTRKRTILSRLRGRTLEQFIESDWEEGRKFIIDNLSQKSVNFVNFISDIIEAEIQGVSVFEKIFHIVGSQLWLKKIPLIPNHLVLYDDINDEYKFIDAKSNDAVLMRTLGLTSLNDRLDFSQINTIDIIPEKLLEVHSLDGNANNGFLNGFTDSLIWAYFFKSFSLKDWSIFLELYAMPARVGKYDSLMTNKKDIDDFTNAVRDFGALYYAVINKDNDIELKDSNKTASSQVYDTFTNYWDTKISIRALGNNITTEVQRYGSNSAVVGAKVVSDEIADSDILLVEQTVNILIEDLIRLNYSNAPEYPKFKIPIEKNLDDLVKKSTVYVNLNQLGYRPVKETLESEFDTELEEHQTQETPDAGEPAKFKFKDTKKITDDMLEEYLKQIWKGEKK